MSKYDQVTAAQSADTDECIPFDGALLKSGHGQLTHEQKHYKAHRLSLCMADGIEYDDAELSALHQCGNAACINPRHLYWGTQADNMRDRVLHGNHPVGEDCNLNTAINATIARDIYVCCKTGPRGTAALLAEYYGISKALVSLIANGKRWAHVTTDVELTEDEVESAEFFVWSLKNMPEAIEAWKAAR